MQNQLKGITGALLIASGSLFCGGVRAADVANRIEKPVRKSITLQQETQRAVSDWRSQKDQYIALYESLEEERENLLNEKKKLQQNNRLLEEHIATKKQQLEDIQQISDQITPFISETVSRLRRLYESDMPFLKEERRRRIESLESLMDDPDVAISEKFRKAMEALMVEAEYGRTIEVYQESIDLGAEQRLVNVFRLGRVSLFYQTLDRRQCGVYNPAERGWTTLSPAYNRDLQLAMDIAAKRRPVELLQLPIGRMAVK